MANREIEQGGGNDAAQSHVVGGLGSRDLFTVLGDLRTQRAAGLFDPGDSLVDLAQIRRACRRGRLRPRFAERGGELVRLRAQIGELAASRGKGFFQRIDPCRGGLIRGGRGGWSAGPGLERGQARGEILDRGSIRLWCTGRRLGRDPPHREPDRHDRRGGDGSGQRCDNPGRTRTIPCWLRRGLGLRRGVSRGLG